MRKCEKAMHIDYGLKMNPHTVLHIADTEKWLLQPELKAIKDGLKYGVIETADSERNYRGYLNKKGQKEGVGIETFPRGEKYIG
jgi:hypothetical protein